MFYYYGRKKQIAKYYPIPNCDTIVEPFAGSAAYSLYKDNWKKKVILVEIDERIASIWKWLIEEAEPKDIRALPDLKIGDKSSDFLHILHAATKMAFAYKTIKVTPVLARNWEISKRYIEQNLYKVKHWQILCCSYADAPDVEATWFVDPPYRMESGRGYKHSSDSIDYGHLAEWALRRRGEIIFCEGEYGDYLPFEDLLDLKGVAGKISRERMFYQSSRAKIQYTLFQKTES
jgi:site-specific DNA-adenine methylase